MHVHVEILSVALTTRGSRILINSNSSVGSRGSRTKWNNVGVTFLVDASRRFRVEIYITTGHGDVARHESNVYSFARFLVSAGSFLPTILPGCR